MMVWDMETIQNYLWFQMIKEIPLSTGTILTCKEILENLCMLTMTCLLKNVCQTQKAVTRKEMFQAFLLGFGTLFVLLGIFEYNAWVVEHPVVKKQYPGAGKVHYTFEQLD